jgi:hypothetical protein
MLGQKKGRTPSEGRVVAVDHSGGTAFALATPLDASLLGNLSSDLVPFGGGDIRPELSGVITRSKPTGYRHICDCST